MPVIGTTLSHFRITAKLGEGGMGEVYRAQDLELKREVAIKLLPADMAHDPQRLERFRREAEAVASLNHPNIVTLYSIESAVADDGSENVGPAQRPAPTTVHFLVMELVDGEPLDRAMPNGGWPLPKVLEIGSAIADALATAHDKGIVHRDLKPANVMLTHDGRIKVLDFGLAKLALEAAEQPGEGATQLATLTQEGIVLGTVPYMSPEQAQGRSVDARSDLFALGSMLYEAATGARPFQADSTIDTLHKIIHAEPEPLSEKIPQAPLQLQWILRKALAKAPEDRYQNARDLVVDLRALRRDLESDTSVPTVLTGRVSAVSVGRQRSPLVWAVGVISLVAVAGLFWMLGRRTATPVDGATAPPAALTKRQLTASGLVTSAAVSPDGEYVVYVESLQGEQSLNLRQVGGVQSLQLIEPRNVAYWGMRFSLDGRSVIYGLKSDDEPNGAMFQISTLGGSSRKLIERMDSTPTFSPDGSRMAWLVANYPSQDQSAIMVADADGGDSRILASFEFPELVAPMFHAGPSWSPDGRLIATSLLTGHGLRSARLIAVDAQNGELEWTSSHEWQWAAMSGWLPEGDGLLLIASRAKRSQQLIASTSGRNDSQVWFVPFPDGEARTLTSDLFDYRIISLTADGKTLLTIPADAHSDMWSMRLGGTERPRKISRSRLDGFFGFDFTPDGSIVYQTLEAGRLDLVAMDPDGSDRRRLTDDEESDQYPRVAPDGRIVVRTTSSAGMRIRRLEPDGSNPLFLVDGLQWGNPDISPDGHWVIYLAITEGLSKIWRVPLDGGTPELAVDRESFLPVVSPDGSRIAFYFRDESDQDIKIGVADFESGELELELEAESFHGHTLLRWAPDGKALLTNTMPRDRANLWRLPLDGGAPERLTDFEDLLLAHFAIAPDGETLVVSRGEYLRDAVLIENFLPAR